MSKNNLAIAEKKLCAHDFYDYRHLTFLLGCDNVRLSRGQQFPAAFG